MDKHYLTPLFSPASIVVFAGDPEAGESQTPYARAMLAGLRSGGYTGTVTYLDIRSDAAVLARLDRRLRRRPRGRREPDTLCPRHAGRPAQWWLHRHRHLPRHQIGRRCSRPPRSSSSPATPRPARARHPMPAPCWPACAVVATPAPSPTSTSDRTPLFSPASIVVFAGDPEAGESQTPYARAMLAGLRSGGYTGTVTYLDI